MPCRSQGFKPILTTRHSKFVVLQEYAPLILDVHFSEGYPKPIFLVTNFPKRSKALVFLPLTF